MPWENVERARGAYRHFTYRHFKEVGEFDSELAVG